MNVLPIHRRIFDHADRMHPKTIAMLHAWGYRITACSRCEKPRLMKATENLCDRCAGRKVESPVVRSPRPRGAYRVDIVVGDTTFRTKDERDARVIEFRRQGATLQQIAGVFGFSRERARQIITAGTRR